MKPSYARIGSRGIPNKHVTHTHWRYFTVNVGTIQLCKKYGIFIDIYNIHSKEVMRENLHNHVSHPCIFYDSIQYSDDLRLIKVKHNHLYISDVFLII